MVMRCLRGKTQHFNESLHHRMWRYCPKHKNANKKMLDLATAQAVSNLSNGYLSSDLCSSLGFIFTENYKTPHEGKLQNGQANQKEGEKAAATGGLGAICIWGSLAGQRHCHNFKPRFLKT